MAGEKIPIVFFPRFTTLVGTKGFETTPIDMLGYESFEMTFWRGDLEGETASPANSMSFSVEESADLVTWGTMVTVPASGFVPNPNATLKVAGTPRQRYIRCIATLVKDATTISPIVSVWAVGYAIKTQM